MAAIGQLRLSCQRPCRQPIKLALSRRADLAVLCRGSDDLRRRSRFSFRYRKSLVSLGFRRLLEKADRAVHRAQPAIQAVAQAEQQVCFTRLSLLHKHDMRQQISAALFVARQSSVLPEHAKNEIKGGVYAPADCLCSHQQAKEGNKLSAMDSAGQGIGFAEYPGEFLVTSGCLESRNSPVQIAVYVFDRCYCSCPLNVSMHALSHR